MSGRTEAQVTAAAERVADAVLRLTGQRNRARWWACVLEAEVAELQRRVVTPAAYEAAVEAGARAFHLRQQLGRMDAGRHRQDGLPWAWEDLLDTDRAAYRGLAREIVGPALATLSSTTEDDNEETL